MPTDYFSVTFDQKPYTYRMFPIMENLFHSQENEIANEKRYHFTFLYDFDKNMFEIVKDYKVDIRFFRYLMKDIIQTKLNQIGMHTREFYSEDLTKIFMVIKCQHNVLQIWAEVSFKFKIASFNPFLANWIQYVDRAGLHRSIFPGTGRCP